MAEITSRHLCLSFSPSSVNYRVCGAMYTSALYERLTRMVYKTFGRKQPGGNLEENGLIFLPGLKDSIYETILENDALPEFFAAEARAAVESRPKDLFVIAGGIPRFGTRRHAINHLYGLSSIYYSSTSLGRHREVVPAIPGFDCARTQMPEQITAEELTKATGVLRNRLEMMEMADRYVQFLGLPLPHGNKCRNHNTDHFAMWEHLFITSQVDIDKLLRNKYLFPEIPEQAGGIDCGFHKPEKFLRAAICDSGISVGPLLPRLNKLVEAITVELDFSIAWLMTRPEVQEKIQELIGLYS